MSRTCIKQQIDSAKETVIGAWEGMDSSLWEEIFAVASQKKPLPESLVAHLIDRCNHFQIVVEKDYLAYARLAFTLVAIYHFSGVSQEKCTQDLQEVYAKLLCHQHPRSWQLPYFYKVTISYLMGRKVEEGAAHVVSKGIALVEYGGHYPYMHLPHALYNAELALLGMILGITLHRAALVESSIKIGEWVAESLALGHPLWMQEETYDPALLMQISRSLFALILHSTPHEKIQKMYDSLQESSAKNPLSAVFALLVKNIVATPRSLSIQYNLDKRSEEENRYLGYVVHKDKSLSCYATVSGARTGFAGIAKGSAQIISIGPHTLPLGDMSHYGIYRTPLLQKTPFKDVSIQKTQNQTLFSGWTGIVDGEAEHPRQGPLWLHVHFQAKDGAACIQTMWMGEENPAMYIALFVKGSKIIVDQKFHLHPSTLDRYQGSVAPLSIHGETTSLQVCAKASHSMQVIPLAGQGCFWGAEFLIAYALQKEETLLLEIK